MKTPSDELFSLIKSLSGAEKLAFKLFSKKNQEYANYLQLFDAMDKLKQYDEKKVQIILDKKGVKNRIKDLKYNLQKVLYRFLQYHHFDSSADVQLQGYMQLTDILYEKGLFPAAQKCLLKAEKKAIEHHQFPYLLLVERWKYQIMMQDQDFAAFDVYQHQHYSTEIHYMNLYKNILEYQKINVRVIRLLITQYTKIDEKAIAKLNVILKNPYLKEEARALSFPAKIMYYRILGDIHYLLKKWEKCCYYLQRVIGYFDQAGLAPGIRLNVYSRLIVSLRELKKGDELPAVINTTTKLVKAVPKKLQTPGLHNAYLSIMNNYIDYQLSINNINVALSASDKIEKLTGKYANPQMFLIYYCNMVLICFYMSDHRNALRYVNKVLSKEKTGIRQDVVSLVKILALIVHYELGNEDMLPNLCKSYSIWFNKQKRQYKAENILLNFFGKIIHKMNEKKGIGIGKQNKIKLLTALKQELELCKTEPILNEFDFISWAESKIQNRPMIDILKEKVRKLES